MDFVIGLPHTFRGFDSIWVIVDQLTKLAHFFLVKMTYDALRYAQLCIDEIVRLHRVPFSIISNRRSQFTSQFWRAFHEDLSTRLDLSTTFHAQTDGQSKRTIQILEDMLRTCVMDFGDNWS
ncbi:DNA-directed DNA polymerase [Bertholletia excelsa]